MPAQNILNKRRIAVLGARSVGKSSLVIQFTENHFVHDYHPTIENLFSKSIKLRGEPYDCDILDTAGQDQYTILNSKYAVGVHGYVLVYSVASRDSLDIVRTVYEKIVDFCGTESIPCIIVGAKTDVKTRNVTSAEAEKVAKLLGAAWIETSAKNNTNVAKVFELCLAEIEKNTVKGQPPRESSCLLM